MQEKDIIQDNNGKVRFKAGTQFCGLCKTKDNIIQFERNTKRKGLPIIEIAFICKSCAVKQGLIKDSVELKTELYCQECKTYGHEEHNCKKSHDNKDESSQRQ